MHSDSRLQLGDLRHSANRNAQRAGGSENCIVANLTYAGICAHNIAPGDELDVLVFENGIVIRRVGGDE